MKKHATTIVLVLILLVGLSLLLYPTVADYWNDLHSTRAIATYTEAVADIDDETYARMWQDAEAFNEQLADTGIIWEPDETLLEQYKGLLDVSGSGIMGYVEIPQISVKLPIYHGTEESVLQVAVGHIAGSSLPVGGESTHCIISGHTGLSSAKLFTDLDDLHEGNLFLIHTLDETLTYQIDQIHTVLPYDLSDLQIVKGKDYCTLVTCTPYGVNSHRLLVRGPRIETKVEKEAVRVTGDALIYDPLVVAPLVALPILLVLLIRLLAGGRGKKKQIQRKEPSDETS